MGQQDSRAAWSYTALISALKMPIMTTVCANAPSCSQEVSPMGPFSALCFSGLRLEVSYL